jgi:uncharacterized membrane protein YhaH (DUF805 family)
MTYPDDESDRTPTQAELDAMDLAALTRSSTESHVGYPARQTAEGPPPAALVRDAWVFWWIAAAAGIASAVYLLLNIGSISDSLQQRLVDDIASEGPNAKAPADQFNGLAHFLPPFMLVVLVVLLVMQYVLLRATGVHHSRNSRNIFLALVLINLVCIPTGMDLLQFAKDAKTMVIVGWIQFGALILAALCTLRPSVGRWLPPSRGLSPVKALRRDGSL